MGGDKRQPIRGPLPRLKNLFVNNFRGILGFVLPIVLLSWQMERGKPMVQVLWLWLFITLLLHPVPVPCAGLIPIFFMPMTGIASTNETTKCYFNDNIALFVIASMLLLLLNNSGFDRRLALYIMSSGDACQFSCKRMMWKCGMAAFFLSMFSNRLITASTIIQYVTPIYVNLKESVGKSTTEPDFDDMRNLVNNAIQTSSSIGSIAILHSAYATIAFRAIWSESALTAGHDYPDIFNYLQYTLFAFPLAVAMFILNIAYHMILSNYVLQRSMSAYTMNTVRTKVLKYKDDIPKKVTVHEKLTLLFTVVLLLVLFLRWHKFPDGGWASYNKIADAAHSPVVKDTTVLALFVFAMHILPRSLNFTQFFFVEKKSELKNVKRESAILFWRFVDRNTNYGYFFLIGAGLALELAIRKTEVSADLSAHLGKKITDLEWYASLFVVCLIACILANVMTGVAGLVCFLPMVINIARDPAQIPWQTKHYLPCLGVGIASSFGFMWPFMYTPAYFCHYTGKVPKMKMAVYSFCSVLICCVLLWFALCFWAPYLWDPNDAGFTSAVAAVVGGGTTPEPPPPPPPPGK